MTCYRHPDREAYVRCQRCERFICPQCQIESAVGFLCPDDAGGTVSQLNRRRTRGARLRSNGPVPAITLTLIFINVAIWLLQIIPGSLVTDALAYSNLSVKQHWWSVITAAFVHDPSNILHVGLNMYSLWIFGNVLEPLLGKSRFTWLYTLSILGGTAGVLFLSSKNDGAYIGASGAIFGLMSAYLVILRSVSQNSNQMVGLIAVNLFIGFVVPGISWQAHVGGLVVGALVALLYSRTRAQTQVLNQRLGLVSILLGLVLVILLGTSSLGLLV